MYTFIRKYAEDLARLIRTMRNSGRLTAAALGLCAAAGFCFRSALAKTSAAGSAVSVTVTLTALAPDYLPAVISQSDVAVTCGKERVNLTSLTRAGGANDALQLAILVDDNIKQQLAGEPMSDLSSFIASLPPSVSVGVFFAQKGKAVEAAEFSSDHAAAAKALTQNIGQANVSVRVYPSLPDLAAHWPSPPAPRREILLIGSGYDALLGGMEDPNMNAGQTEFAGTNYDRDVSGEKDTYLNAILTSVEQAGIEVHSVYVPDPEFAQMAQASIMRDKLAEASSETGGLGFFSASSLDAFASYLRELSSALRSQYILTFTTEASRKRKGELRPLHISVSQPDVTIYAPGQVFVAGK